MKLDLNSFCETERNSLSMASRKALSAEAAFTASIPLMASIWCELYLPWLSSTPAKSGRRTFTEKIMSPTYNGVVARKARVRNGL